MGNGVGIEQDFERASNLYEIAAESGLPASQYNLAVLCAQGDGLDQDPEKAKYWYKQAAEQGYELAELALAQMEVESTLDV